MTSANRSGEPLAYQDEDAFERLAGIADAFLVGERPIARRVDDSVVRIGPCGPTILRRARGYAPGAVATIPVDRPVLALGADLKNSVTLVVDGQAFMSQYIGDLEDQRTDESFRATIRDLMRLYDVSWKDVLVACDAHPGYRSTAWAERLPTGPSADSAPSCASRVGARRTPGVGGARGWCELRRHGLRGRRQHVGR